MQEKVVTTIGWWNGQSTLLKDLHRINAKLFSIVSMSDDWRTTWKLMRLFKRDLDLHFPPPWDLRRCLFSVSGSSYSSKFEHYFETVINHDVLIKDLTLKQIFWLVWVLENDDFMIYLDTFDNEFLNFVLPINDFIKGHKLWNILMWSLFYNLWKDYNRMMDFMSQLLEVRANIIPVTTDSAFIEAVLDNGDIIQTQDHISNVPDYKWKVKELRLMEESRNAKHNKDIDEAILTADYIVISTWDLFTSIISNLIIWEVKELLKKSNAKIIFIWNSTNKWWEAEWYGVMDFILKVEEYLWREVDYFIANDRKPDLTDEQERLFKENISVKWWDYIFLNDSDRDFLRQRWTKVIEEYLLDKRTLYKHNTLKLVKIIEGIIF